MNKAIHGALRRDLDRFIAALHAFRAGDLIRARQLGTAWANFDAQLTDHHEGEHRIAWPALAAVGVSASLLDTLDAEHAAMASALAQARTTMATLARTADESDARRALASMETLRDVTIAHLEHEEAEIEPVYLSKRDAPEIKAMGRAFARVSPARGGQFFAWVTDGATAEETAAVHGNVPKPVLTVLTGVWGRAYRRDVAPVWRT